MMRLLLILFAAAGLAAVPATSPFSQLARNTDFRRQDASKLPSDYILSDGADYCFIGQDTHDTAAWGVALQSSKQTGSVSQTIARLDPSLGRCFRFSFRGLPEDHFAVTDDGLYMRVDFSGGSGTTFFDSKTKRLYGLIERDRRDMAVNGDHRVGGAAVWRTYQFDIWLPFPQVDQVRLSVGFDHGAARTTNASRFFISDFSFTRTNGLAPNMPQPGTPPHNSTQPADGENPEGTLIPIGGRWYYRGTNARAVLPRVIDFKNADRLLYHDNRWTAPFAGEMSAWLRAGDKDLDGNVINEDRLVADNVTIEIDSTSLIIHTHNLPNHATGRFPETGPGPHNPNYIQEQDDTYCIPLNPQVNPRHFATATDNSNHALPMGPIGIAMNGVVFFNPFDAGNMDASSIMDRCCGHPNQDNLYHYHKYPICINSPWRDEGSEHSPLIGWAFDGFPVYGPYQNSGVMAKDITGDGALNDFNLHYDKDRGWHYHVTPGKFPYIIGGYWGTEDSRDRQHPRHRQ